MSVKEVKRFLNEVKNNKEYSEFVRKKLSVEALDEKHLDSLVSEEIVPFARNHNFDLTKEDFEIYAENQNFRQIDIDELEGVAGGKNVFSKSAISMFMCLTEVAGLVSSNLAHAENPNPTQSAVQGENKAIDSQETEEQTDQNQSEGEDVSAKDNNGKTALHRAVEDNKIDIIGQLIGKGSDINAQDDNGNVPLHYAAENNSKDVVELLISNGANLDIQNKEGKSPYHIIAEKNGQAIEAITKLQKILWLSYDDISFFQDDNTQKELEEIEKILPTPKYRQEFLRIIISFIYDDNFDIISSRLKDKQIQLEELPFRYIYNYEILKKFHDAGVTIFSGGKEVVFEDGMFKLGRIILRPISEAVEDTELKKIIEEDNREELQAFFVKNGESLKSFVRPFNEMEELSIPLMQYCAIKGAKKCFDYLIINYVETAPKQTVGISILNDCRYSNWDCLAMAIYFNRIEMIKILEDYGFRKENDPVYLEAAVLSYRNGIAEEIIGKLKEQNDDRLQEFLNRGLLMAAKVNNIEGADRLINAGADINKMNGFMYTPLFCAIENDCREIVELLINKGANVNIEAVSGTPLHKAVGKGSKEIVEVLISKGAYINVYDIERRTPLHRAVDKGSKEIIELLISKGADINVRDGAGDVPLHKAIDKGSKEMVELLISKGADINAKDRVGNTPLHKVVYEANIGGHFIVRGGYIVREDDSKTPLHLEAGNNSAEICEILTSKGAYINARDQWGRTPLHWAAVNNSAEICEILISKGADIDARDQWGKTPLHWAAENNSAEICKILISKGADINAMDNDGRFPSGKIIQKIIQWK